MSDGRFLGRSSWRSLAYALVVVLAVLEMGVVWLMLHPQVPPAYHAYYIDRTTTCLDQPVRGDYAMGTLVSFRAPGGEASLPLWVCGWEGPAGDGTHAVGTASRLRFALDRAGALTLRLELVAITRDGVASQRVDVVVNGTVVGTAQAQPETPQWFVFAVPAALAAQQPAALDVLLRFPEAVRIGPTDSDARMRSIKLTGAQLSPG